MLLKRNINLIIGFKKIDDEQYFSEKYVGKSIFLFIVYDDLLKVVKFLEFKENIFIWRYGDLEDVILSLLNQKLNEEIVEIFECKLLMFKVLKDKLKK